MTKPRATFVAASTLLALTVPFGIAVHLVSELAGLGYRNDAALIFSAKHVYLAVLALGSLLTFFALLASVSRSGSERRRVVKQLIAALPFEGRGPRFTLLSFTGQIGFFFVTQFGEGCPLSANELGAGILAAFVASAIGALALSLCNTQLIRAVVELFSLLEARIDDEQAFSAHHRIDAHVRVWHCRALIERSSNLPPPHLLSIA